MFERSDPRGPLHIHVRGGGATAKEWLEPSIGVAESHGFNSEELSSILRLVIDNRQLIETTWREYFSN
ncbi:MULTISPECIES: DUF4160 domain-containing protein [unclassified Shinella]|uniref:DUF4160 domain-containing protein n=1 Tax=unclassified Shinella TaxID=2643062 RepID=UPI003FA725C9